MEEKQILQEKIEQCRRLIAAITDALTIERLQVRQTELEERLAELTEDQSQFTVPPATTSRADRSR